MRCRSVVVNFVWIVLVEIAGNYLLVKSAKKCVARKGLIRIFHAQ